MGDGDLLGLIFFLPVGRQQSCLAEHVQVYDVTMCIYMPLEEGWTL